MDIGSAYWSSITTRMRIQGHGVKPDTSSETLAQENKRWHRELCHSQEDIAILRKQRPNS